MPNPEDAFFLTDTFLGDHMDVAKRARDRINPVPVRTGNQITTENLQHGTGTDDPTSAAEIAAGCNMGSTNPIMLITEVQNNWEKLSKTLGLSEQCTRTARTALEQTSGGGSAAGISLFGVVGAEYNFDSTKFDNYMSERGCGTMGTNLQSVYNQMSSLKCQYASMSTQSNIIANANSSVTVRIIQPSAAAAAAIRETLRDYDDNIRSHDLNRPTPAQLAGLSIEMVNVWLASHERTRSELIRSKNLFQAENPMVASVTNSTINATTKAETTVSVIAEFDTTSTTQVKTAIANAATAVASSAIEQSLGGNALQGNARNFVSSQANNITEQRINQIISQISSNTVRSRSDTQSEIEITGRVSGSTLNAMAASTVDAKVHTTMKAAISIGEELASNIVTSLDAEHSIITRSDGINDALQAILSSATERRKNQNDHDKSFWGGFFTMTSVIVIILIIVGGYFGYKYLQGRSGGGTKYGRRY